jgi:hypothetical protein
MSLFTITFDSSTDTEYDAPADDEFICDSVSDHPGVATNKAPLTPALNPTLRYRNLTGPIPRSLPLRRFGDPHFRIVVARRTYPKLNGIRALFKGLDDQKQLFLAKAKSLTAKSIPITRDSRIHLRSESNYIASLIVDKDQTDFTLVEKGNRAHFLVVQFSSARLPEEGMRRSHIRFLCNAGIPPQLISLPLTEVLPDISFPIQSIKNTVFGDDTHQWQIAVKKLTRHTLEIRSRTAIDPLCLFAIGVSLFLGKAPTR